MGFVSLVGSKIILAICNFLLLACGFLLVSAGMLTLLDTERLLLSKLLATGSLAAMPQPLFYYVALGLSAVGLLLATVGVLGCWASCLQNYCLLALYFLAIILVLIGEFVVYTLAWAWPNCLGLGIDSEDLTRALQSYYGMEDQQQFTAAVDLAQTLFECCGIESANEYDTSLWRLQPEAPSLAIPWSCCKITNTNQLRSYLNPMPLNQTLCQTLEFSMHEGYRHTKGCYESLQEWYREHHTVLLIAGVVLIVVEFLVLLSTILTCTKVYKHKQTLKEEAKKLEEDVRDDGSSSQAGFRRNEGSNVYGNEAYDYRHGYKMTEKA